MHSSNSKYGLDFFDALIFEQGLRIKRILFDKDLDTMLLLLNNGKVIQQALSRYNKLAQASQEELEDFTLTQGGIHWIKLDEDISLRSILKEDYHRQVAPTISTPS